MKIAVLSIMLSLFLTSSAMSEEATYTEGDFSYSLTDRGVVLEDWLNWEETNAQPALIVPSSLGGTTVVGIGSGAFETCHSGPFSVGFEIVIPEGVVFLEEGAFECCSNASIIYLPSTLQTIPEGSFIHVGAEISFPQGSQHFNVDNGFLIDSRTQTLLYSAPSSVGKELPDVSRLGQHSLENWIHDQTVVNVPEGLQSIGAGVFYDQPCLERVVLPTTLIRLDANSFFATGIQEINIPAGLEKIPPYCFVDCMFTSISIPLGIEWIGEYAFYYNWELTEVTLAESVQFVGYNAFPEECDLIALNPTTHFETLEEYQVRDPQGEW